MTWEMLPTINAFFNGASAVLLAIGFFFIMRGDVARHRAMMISAFCTSTLFLVGYLTHHAHAGHVRYQGDLRGLYFTILITHTILAIVILPMILRTLYLALKQRFDVHRQWARWTLPMWFYVSVTGVVIYAMVY